MRYEVGTRHKDYKAHKGNKSPLFFEHEMHVPLAWEDRWINSPHGKISKIREYMNLRGLVKNQDYRIRTYEGNPANSWETPRTQFFALVRFVEKNEAMLFKLAFCS